jgi:hypothetical protein
MDGSALVTRTGTLQSLSRRVRVRLEKAQTLPSRYAGKNETAAVGRFVADHDSVFGCATDHHLTQPWQFANACRANRVLDRG